MYSSRYGLLIRTQAYYVTFRIVNLADEIQPVQAGRRIISRNALDQRTVSSSERKAELPGIKSCYDTLEASCDILLLNPNSVGIRRTVAAEAP